MTVSTNGATWLKPFLTGFITAFATSQLLLKNKKVRTIPNTFVEYGSSFFSSFKTRTTNTDGNKNKENSIPLMDSPKLDQRIIRKAEAALLNRTSRLIIVVERCTNDHNYSAILRTAEALGVQNVYIIAPQAINESLKFDESLNHDGECDKMLKTIGNGNESCDINSSEEKVTTDNVGSSDNDDEDEEKITKEKYKQAKLYRSTGQQIKQVSKSEVQDRAMHHLFAQRALEWLDVREFDTTQQCIDVLRQEGYQIWSTDLSQEAVCLTREGLGLLGREEKGREVGTEQAILPEKLAIVFGTEAVGCTTEILNASDKRVYLPLRGFADSLNLSVATALIVHQLFVLDPTLIGSMPEEKRVELRRRWYSKLASQRLLTRTQKASKRRLANQIRAYEQLEWRLHNSGGSENGSEKAVVPLQREQIAKVEQLPELRSKLEDLEKKLEKDSLMAVEGLVDNPPEPLGDMRRADEHRTSYVGKNTKKQHSDVWADMPATKYYQTEDGSLNGSAAFFRGRLNK